MMLRAFAGGPSILFTPCCPHARDNADMHQWRVGWIVDETDDMTILQGVMRDHFRDQTLVIDASTDADDVEGWDSLSHSLLILRLERTLGIKFSVQRADHLQSVKAILGAIAAARGGAQP